MEQANRSACTGNLLEIQECYNMIVRERNHASVLRSEYQQTVAVKEQMIQEQQRAYRAQEERERREREEAARRAAQEAARRAEQQKAAERMAAAQQTVSTGRVRRGR